MSWATYRITFSVEHACHGPFCKQARVHVLHGWQQSNPFLFLLVTDVLKENNYEVNFSSL